MAISNLLCCLNVACIRPWTAAVGPWDEPVRARLTYVATTRRR
jgi:hypothetical protein